jgi:hypothetical protein
MPQAIRHRTQNTIQYSSGNKVSQDLLLGLIYREIYLRLQGAATVTTGNNTQAKVLKGDEWATVQKIELKANGTDVIRSFSGNTLWWLNYFLYSMHPTVTPGLGDGATANAPFDSLLVLPLWMPRAIVPMDTVIDSSRVQSLTLEITWASYTAMNASNSAWTTEPTLQVMSLESFFTDGGKITPANWRIYELNQTITAANSKLQTKLNTGPTYRGFLINCESDGVDVSTILNNLKITSGSTVYYDLPGSAIQQITNQRMAVGGNRFNGQTYDDLRIGNKNSADGWYYIDLVTDGRMSESIDSLGLSELIIETDVAKPGTTDKIFIYPMEIIPVRGGGK